VRKYVGINRKMSEMSVAFEENSTNEHKLKEPNTEEEGIGLILWAMLVIEH